MNLLLFILIVLVSEIILAFLFAATAKIFYKKIGIDFTSILKGFLERMFLMIFLINDYSSALTFYSALKLATRLRHEEKIIAGDKESKENRFNDYYLIGNLVSVSVALGYVFLIKNCFYHE